MNYGLYITASGLATQVARQDALSNNLANVNTTAYKPDVFAVRERLSPSLRPQATLEEWKEFMSEFLLEAARVIKGGSRAVFMLRDQVRDGRTISYEEELLSIVRDGFSRYWEAEYTYIQNVRATPSDEETPAIARSRKDSSAKLLVLRRK